MCNQDVCAPIFLVGLGVFFVVSGIQMRLGTDKTWFYPSDSPRVAPVLGFRGYQMAQAAPIGRGGGREPGVGEAITDTQSLSSFRTAGLGTSGPTESLQSSRPRSLSSLAGSGNLLRAPVFHTTIPERLRRDVISYVVERGTR